MIKAKRLLTDQEFDHYVNLQTEQAKKKYLENIKEELWENLDQKK